MSKIYGLIVCVALAMGVRGVALMTHAPDKTPWSDGAQYVNLGISLADGHGYVLHEGNLWPGEPTIIRAPGWPVMMSVIFRWVPAERRWESARAMAMLLDGAANVVLIFLLARGLGAGCGTATAAAALYASSPVLGAMCVMPASEIAGIFFLLLFLNYLVRVEGQSLREFLVAGLLLGVAALVRPNFLLIAGVLAAGLLCMGRRRILQSLGKAATLVLAALIPLTPWLIRNAAEFGHFPILGAGGGETFYGGNNDRAAEHGGVFEGYLVLPGDLPGEKRLPELAGTMNEYAVDRYLLAKGLAWVKAHPGKMPRLVLMKLKRAYVPLTRTHGLDVLVCSGYRWMIDGLALAGIILYARGKFRLRPIAWLALGAVMLAHAGIAALFCGLNRFVLPSEVLLVIPAGYAVMRLFSAFMPKQDARHA